MPIWRRDFMTAVNSLSAGSENAHHNHLYSSEAQVKIIFLNLEHEWSFVQQKNSSTIASTLSCVLKKTPYKLKFCSFRTEKM